MTIAIENITGVILAGGQGRRMGGRDKGLIELHGHLLIEYAIETLRPQVGRLVINANRNQERYEAYGLPVISDLWPDYRGPLAGIASTLARIETDYLLSVPCDIPSLPPDLCARLAQALERESAPLAVAQIDGRMQPVCALLHRSLTTNLCDYLERGERRAQEWARSHGAALADFSDRPADFDNLNTPEDLSAAPAPRRDRP